MQDRYVGDVGDYGKYGLLRFLTTETGQPLGVIWCLYADEAHNADGRHVSYLRSASFAGADPVLHSKLDAIVSKGQRTVKAIATSRLLPAGTSYFASPISDSLGVRMSRQERAGRRASWLKAALVSTKRSDIVFFDPDNGLETASVQRHSPKSGKYIFWDEIMPFWDRGQSLIIYHHLNRTAPIARQAETLREKFEARFPDAGLRLFLLFRRGSCRHFWVVGQKSHATALRLAVNNLMKSDWRDYFEVG
jgi:hypothetical protein